MRRSVSMGHLDAGRYVPNADVSSLSNIDSVRTGEYGWYGDTAPARDGWLTTLGWPSALPVALFIAALPTSPAGVRAAGPLTRIALPVGEMLSNELVPLLQLRLPKRSWLENEDVRVEERPRELDPERERLE